MGNHWETTLRGFWVANPDATIQSGGKQIHGNPVSREPRTPVMVRMCPAA